MLMSAIKSQNMASIVLFRCNINILLHEKCLHQDFKQRKQISLSEFLRNLDILEVTPHAIACVCVCVGGGGADPAPTCTLSKKPNP